MKKPISAWVMRRMGPQVPVVKLAVAVPLMAPLVVESARFFSG